MKELDSTQALLDSTIEIVDSVLQDESEDEIFFGTTYPKEMQRSKKLRRRDTMEVSSTSDWRTPWESNRDKLSMSSASTGRSSLLDMENSIMEEEEEEQDEVFEDVAHEEQADDGAVEIEFSQCSSALGASFSDPAPLEMSGIKPLSSGQNTDGDQSASGIYDSFSDATTEEVLEDFDDEEEKLAHARRKILQDSTFMSSVSSLEEAEVSGRKDGHNEAEGELPSESPVTTPTPAIVITETVDSPEEIPASPESVYVTAPSSRRNTSVSGADSPMFDTTVEEMALYEIYGEDYDEVVAAMSRQEKVELRKRLESRDEVEKIEIQQKYEKIAEAAADVSVTGSSRNQLLSVAEADVSVTGSSRNQLLSVASTVSPFSLNSSVGTPSPQVPELIPAGEPMEESPMLLDEPAAMEEAEPVAGPSSTGPQFNKNFMLPTVASLNKMASPGRSPSPSPRKKMPWIPPSPSPCKPLTKSPHSSVRQTPVSRLPVLVKRAAQPESSPGPRTPLAKRVAGVKSAFAAVASPVASYVKNNPAPHLVQNVKAKEPVNPLESTMVEVEEKENNARLSLLPACPLPSAVYKASTLVTGDESSSEDRDEYEYVTEAYGAVSQSAKVTKHVSRVKLPATGLTWNEDLLEYDESWNSSPSMAKFKPPGKPLLKATRRDSGLFDESMMNVSVVETKVVKKVARGKGGARGRGKGKGKQRLIDRNPYH